MSGASSAVASIAATPDSAATLPSVGPVATWRDLVKKGEYASAYATAERAGAFDNASSSSAAEVAELAELARLAGRADVARKLYLTVRDRAAGSDTAAMAAFQLGRMSGSGADGERWFRVYLTERPNGTFGAEALGRILEIEHRAGRASVQQTAARYLQQFPSGAHAALARSLLEP